MNEDEVEALKDMYENWGYGTVRGYLDKWDDEQEDPPTRSFTRDELKECEGSKA